MTRYEAYTQKDWRERGPSPVLVARIRDGDRVEVGYFWVDQFCLGVRHALYDDAHGEADFRALLDDEIPEARREPIHPAWAKAFIEGAIAYAERFGFAPPKDYRKARRVLSGLDATLCTETFTYGHEGKPLYLETESDSPERTERVLAQLEARCGPDGFDYELLDDEDDDAEPEDDSYYTARAGLMDYFGADDSGLTFYEFSGMVMGLLSCPHAVSTGELVTWTSDPARRQPRDVEEAQIYFSHVRHYWNFFLPVIASCHDGPLEEPEAPIDIQPEDFTEKQSSEEEAQSLILLHMLWCRGFMNTTELWPEAWGDVPTRPDLAPYWSLLRTWASVDGPGGITALENFPKETIPGKQPLATALRAIIRASPRRPVYPAPS